MLFHCTKLAETVRRCICEARQNMAFPAGRGTGEQWKSIPRGISPQVLFLIHTQKGFGCDPEDEEGFQMVKTRLTLSSSFVSSGRTVNSLVRSWALLHISSFPVAHPAFVYGLLGIKSWLLKKSKW